MQFKKIKSMQKFVSLDIATSKYTVLYILYSMPVHFCNFSRGPFRSNQFPSVRRSR